MKKERKRYIQKKEKKRVYVWLTMEEFARLDANVKRADCDGSHIYEL